MRFLIRLVITAASLWVAVKLVPGLSYDGPLLNLLVVAIVFGVLNAFVRPLLFLLTCPLIMLTLGLFTLVLNGVLLWLTGTVSDWLGLGFHVNGFWAAFLGALVVSIVSAILSIFVGGDEKKEIEVVVQKQDT
jgi:putative membrane protein